MRLSIFLALLVSFCFFIGTSNVQAADLTTTTVKIYPDEDPEIYTHDANLYGEDWLFSWQEARDQLGDTYYCRDKYATPVSGYTAGSLWHPEFGYDIARSQYLFRYVLPANSTIVSAKMNIFFYDKRNSVNDEYSYVNVVSSNPVNNTFVDILDFQNFGTVNWSDELDIAGIILDSYTKFNFNGNGIGQLLSDGEYHILKTGLREGHDLENIPCVAYSAVSGYYAEQTGTSMDPYLEITYTVPETPSELEPVIVVPGIAGSWGVAGMWFMDPILHTYDNLIEAMIASGYELDKTLFPLPYNWRLDNTETAVLLKQEIDKAKTAASSNQVDIVAHSMGGLIARHYVQGGEYADDVDQVVFLNTPHLGATESYLAYEGAKFLGLVGPIKKFVFGQEALRHGYLSLTKYIQEQIPSTGQLLPIFDYLQDEVKKDWITRVYPTGYPVNVFLDVLNTASGTSDLIVNADVTNIYSYAETAVSPTTLRTIKVKPDKKKKDVKWEHGKPACKNKKDESCWVMDVGDKTVPFNSLEFLGGVNEIVMADTTHRGIVSAAQQDVIKVLTGERPDDYISSTWGAIRRLLFIRVYSPVDFLVIAPGDKKIGKDFNTDTDINELAEEGAFYSGFDTEAEFVTIINPIAGKEYRVLLEGIADGSFGLGVDILEEDGLSGPEENIINGNIEAGEYREYSFIIDEESNEVVITMNTLFTKLIADLNELNDELNSDDEINKDSVYQTLRLRFEHLAVKYEELQNEARWWKQQLLKAQLLVQLNVIKTQLQYYEIRGWITLDAYGVLVNDIDGIINEIT